MDVPSPNNAKTDPPLSQWAHALEHERSSSCSAHIDRVVILEQTTSTQDAARKEAAPHERILVLASRQIAGRGRLGRQWADTGDKGVSMSFGLQLRKAQHQYISLVAAVATADALEAALATSQKHPSGCDGVRIRWPNDIMLRSTTDSQSAHSLAKIAGILIEHNDSHTIIGIGINVHQQYEDWPPALRETAISLCQAGCIISRLTVATLLMRSLCTWLDKTHDEMMRFFLKRDCLVGTVHTFVYDNKHFQGRVVAMDPTTTIIVALENGTHVRLPAQATSLVHSRE